MQCYLVGGAVRDRLLGLPVKDRDFVVVGATPDEILAQGFTPVGRDFPVFLHPQTHEEYALARTERKTAPGYKGFVFHAQSDVTLEEDLARRDLTINAIAQTEDGCLIDPFNGQADLQAHLLRHVSPAFLEDPIRILRVARFSARFCNFSVVPETSELMRRMVEIGEVDALVPERTWQEFSRGLMEAAPSRMLQVLYECAALTRIFPILSTSIQEPAQLIPTLVCLDAAAKANATLSARWALMWASITKSSETTAHARDVAGNITHVEAACRTLKVPSECRDLATMVQRELRMLEPPNTTAANIVALFERCDAFRKPARFTQMLAVLDMLYRNTANIDSQGVSDTKSSTNTTTDIQIWERCLNACLALNAGQIAASVQATQPVQPLLIQSALRAARIDAVSACQANCR